MLQIHCTTAICLNSGTKKTLLSSTKMIDFAIGNPDLMSHSGCYFIVIR